MVVLSYHSHSTYKSLDGFLLQVSFTVDSSCAEEKVGAAPTLLCTAAASECYAEKVYCQQASHSATPFLFLCVQSFPVVRV